MKFLSLLCFAILIGIQVLGQGKITPLYKNRAVSVESRINDLIKRMTFEEKVLQLNQYTLGSNNNLNNIEDKNHAFNPRIGSLIYFDQDPVFRNKIQKRAVDSSRLGIPILFGFDVIHGFKTIYPIPLAIACSWNPELGGKACMVAAKEAKLSGVDWTFSPMIDISRDPRWGRVAEGYGEDPYTNAVFGAAAVRAYQGRNLSDPYSIAACLKHYVGYGVSEGGRDYRYSDVSAQALWETYLIPYQAGVKAGAATLMSAFNDISGIPATANNYTLNEILKKRWKHDGFVVSDWKAVEQLIYQGVAKDRAEAAEKAFMAGVDMDMLDNVYLENLKQLVQGKKVPMSRIDDAVKRILRVKFRLGLFDKPYATVIDTPRRYLQPADKNIATQLAEESMVLLKNNKNILPLSPSTKIALIGPMAENSLDMMGSWRAHGSPADVITIFEGLKTESKSTFSLNYSRGCDFDGNDQSGFDAAVSAAKQSDVIVLCLGEKGKWSGENASRSTIALPIIQEQLFTRLANTGKPIVLILSNGRPLELVRLESHSDAILEAWQPGTMGGSAIAGILSGRLNPSGKLAITFPLTTGQIPIYYNMRPSARPYDAMGDYQDIPTTPIYQFGYGLSYTTFAYHKLELSNSKIRKGQTLVAKIEVENTGKNDGKEVVLWYISHPSASISRPVKELKYFEKKRISAGNKTSYTFMINPEKDLSFYDSDGKTRLEPGFYEVAVGDQKVKFELTN